MPTQGGVEELDDFLSLMILSARWAATAASIELLRGDEPVNTEYWLASDLPPAEVGALIAALGSADDYTTEDHALHLGQPQIPADRATHKLLVEFLCSRRPEAVVVGEESTADEWQALDHLPAGAEVFVLDAIDGSGPYQDLTFGYGTTIIQLVRQEMSKFAYRGSLTANAAGYFLVQDRRDVFVGNALGPGEQADAVQIGQPLLTDGSSSVAVVAARPGHRLLLKSVLDWDQDERFRIYTLGGSPAALALAVGRLSALVCPFPQATWDAAFLPALAEIGCTVLRADGKRVDRTEAASWLEQLDSRSKPVPPFVVYGNPADHAWALELLQVTQRSR